MRMKSWKVLVTIACALSFASCNDSDNIEGGTGIKAPEPIVLNVTEQAMASGQLDFATSFFSALYQQKGKEENLLVSPFSLHCALGMLSNGANGETRDAILRTMGMEGYSQDEVNDYFQKLMEGLNGVDPDASVSTGNSIWNNERYELLPAFCAVNSEKYKAQIEALDFTNPASVDVINAWCEEKTEGKIPKILESVDASAYVYLLNALYFKARWENEFSEGQTTSGTFHAESGDTPAHFMHSMQIRSFVQNELFSCTSLPYVRNAYYMYFVLPHEGVAMDDVVRAIAAPGAWNTCWKEGGVAEVNFSVPRFEIENRFELKEALRALGMEQAFSPEADFSALLSVPDKPSIISSVLQASSLKVNEEGSEGASVTAILISTANLPGEMKQINFTLDRPFLFLITEGDTNTVLFMGKVGKPE